MDKIDSRHTQKAVCQAFRVCGTLLNNVKRVQVDLHVCIYRGLSPS